MRPTWGLPQEPLKRRRRSIHRAAMLALIGATLCALSAEPATAQTTTSTTAPSSEPLIDVEGQGALIFIAGIALGAALLWFLPLVYDVYQTNRWRRKEQKAVLSDLVKNSATKLTVEEIRQLVSAMDQPPRGASGLTQSLLALVIASLVGIALATTLVSTATDSPDLRKTIVTALLSILATIAGFYYGARTAQTSTEQATHPPSVSTTPDASASPNVGSGPTVLAGSPAATPPLEGSTEGPSTASSTVTTSEGKGPPPI